MKGGEMRGNTVERSCMNCEDGVSAKERLLGVTVGLLLLTLGWLSGQQTEVWRDNVGFYSQEVDTCMVWSSSAACQSSHNNLGLELMMRDHCSQAIQVLEAGLAMSSSIENSSEESMWLTLTTCMVKEGRLEEALQVVEKANLALPSSAKILVNQGSVLARHCRITEARTAYQEAIILSPGWETAIGALAQLEATAQSCASSTQPNRHTTHSTIHSSTYTPQPSIPGPSSTTSVPPVGSSSSISAPTPNSEDNNLPYSPSATSHKNQKLSEGLHGGEKEEKNMRGVVLEVEEEEEEEEEEQDEDLTMPEDYDTQIERLPSPVVITWPVAYTTGWGVFSRNLLTHMLRSGRHTPMLTRPLEDTPEMLAVFTERELQSLRHWQNLLWNWMRNKAKETFASEGGGSGGVQQVALHLPVLHGLGNDFAGSFELPLHLDFAGKRMGFVFTGKPTIGIIFIEDTRPVDPKKIQMYDHLVAGSSWTVSHLRKMIKTHNKRGLHPHISTKVSKALQGVDPTLHSHRGPHPPIKMLLKKQFNVFSGGKLEFRKGQDLVLSAFLEFRRVYAPEAVLVTQWHTDYPHLARGLGDSPITQPDQVAVARCGSGPPPDSSPQALDQWVQCCGLEAPEGALNLPPLSEADLASAMRDVHLAVFLSRAESGTNLFATQALAMGIPSVLSNNTGHRDLLRVCSGTPLLCRAAPQLAPPFRLPSSLQQGRQEQEEEGGGTQGWGESDVEQVVESMRQMYQAYQTGDMQDGKDTSLNTHRVFSWKILFEHISHLISSDS